MLIVVVPYILTFAFYDSIVVVNEGEKPTLDELIRIVTFVVSPLLIAILIVMICGWVKIFRSKISIFWKLILSLSLIIPICYLIVFYTCFNKIYKDAKNNFYQEDDLLKGIKFHSKTLLISVSLFISSFLISLIIMLPNWKIDENSLSFISFGFLALWLCLIIFIIFTYSLMVYYGKFLNLEKYKKLKLYTQIPFINLLLWKKNLKE